MEKGWIIFAGGEWVTWKPRPGLDFSVGDSAMWSAAACYAFSKKKGLHEEVCHQEAEKVAYQIQYGVKY